MFLKICVVQSILWKLAVNSDLSVNILSNVLSLLNHICQLDGISNCPVREFNSVWHRLQTITSQYTDNSMLSSSAVLTLAIVIRHASQSDVSQSVYTVVHNTV